MTNGNERARYPGLAREGWKLAAFTMGTVATREPTVAELYEAVTGGPFDESDPRDVEALAAAWQLGADDR